jgi:hypothetical protein
MSLEEYGPEIKPLARAKKRLERKEAKARAVAKPPRAYTKPVDKVVAVTLTMPHFINGVAYGPGVVKIPQHMVAGLLDTEQRVRENDARLTGKRAAFIGPGGRPMPVPYEAFDSPLLNVLEAMTVS